MDGCSSTSAETFKHYEPSPAQHHKRYHVFLSCRGTDVRNTLVDHLFNSLSTAGFHVFLETESLGKGKNIEVSLEEGIRNSTVHIPIFSANYASSAWCLEELSFIWTSKSTGTQTTIIPLFYNVKPSDVRHPENVNSPYAKAFQEHREKKRHSQQKINAWKEALLQVSLLSGWSLPETAAGYEGRLVKVIVEDLLKTLEITSLHVAKHSEGLVNRTEEVTELLEMNDHTCRLGICGMGGLGKSLRKFEASCFVRVRDVRTSSVLNLQKEIFRRLAKVNESTLNKVPMPKFKWK